MPRQTALRGSAYSPATKRDRYLRPASPVVSQFQIHQSDETAINTISTTKMATLNPTIHPMMAISHDAVAGNRVALHMAIGDANAEQATTTQAPSVVGGAVSGDNKKTGETSATSANDRPAPNSSALSKPFMWSPPCEAYRQEARAAQKVSRSSFKPRHYRKSRIQQDPSATPGYIRECRSGRRNE